MSITNFKINDDWYSVDLAALPADITLNTFIRQHAQLSATKFMCLEGGCGACVVTIRGKNLESGEIKTWAANSCLTLLNTCVNWEITTCEGIGSRGKGYHPIQKRVAKLNATQCGYCTPGFVMNMYSLLESKNNNITMQEIENSFGGNLCRCTGYRSILDAMKGFATDRVTFPKGCQDIEDLSIKTCPNSGELCSAVCKQTPIKELLYDNGTAWYWPKTFDALYEILEGIKSSDKYMLVGGNTAHGIYRRSEHIKHFIDIHGLVDLKQHNISEKCLTLGAALTLSEAMEVFKAVARQPGFEYCQQLWRHFDLMANVPVRNTGTLGGNIAIKKRHKEFASDLCLLLEALECPLIVCTKASDCKRVTLSEYLNLQLPKLVILAIELPCCPHDTTIFNSYRVMPRAQNAQAYVNAAFLINADVTTGIVSKARLCFGGISPEFTRATALEKLLEKEHLYDSVVVARIFTELSKCLQPTQVLPQVSPEYRRIIGCALMFKFLLENAPADMVKPEYLSGAHLLKRNLSSGLQIFDTQKQYYPVTQPIEKIEGLIQSSGEAIYINDMKASNKTVFCAFVGATVVGATIEQIIPTDALATPGVIAFYTAKDIPGINTYVGPEFLYEKEEIFASEVVKFYDQPLGLIVAETSDIALRAVSKVKVIYSIGDGLVMPTIADVLENKRFDRVLNIASTSVTNLRLSDMPDLQGKGIFEMGLQYHFTMEPHTCVAVPFEQGLQVWSSTQGTNHTQSVIAKMLKLKAADVQMKVRRIGGAYGCKITGGNRVACATSLAAYTLNRPTRFVQDIESMMNSVGKRWACSSDYEFHVKSDGKIVGLRNTFYEDAGWNLNENPIQQFTIRAARNCYEFTADNFQLDGKAVLTDAPSNLYCRAPGALEGIAMMENIMEHIAFATDLDPADVRQINIPLGHKMRELLPQFLSSRDYKQRRREINELNTKNRWMKKGIGLAIMENKSEYLGGYPATVAVYHTDGSVVISHGGVEMGQGLNTKVAQVAAYHLGVPLDRVKIEPSDTVNGASSYDTSLSVASECVCYAVRKACNTLIDRLKPIRESLKPNATWQEVVQAAFVRSISLIVTEAFQLGDMNTYSIYGLALTEVEVDILTGNLIIQRVDILEDCGESLSPNIDVGQVEGAFIMAIGYWLTEKLVYDRQTGQLLTNRTLNYKPPGAKDIPVDFRVELLQGSSNRTGFMRSKSSGEPPCCLAVSVIFAIQQALQSARDDANAPKEWIRLGAPTTPETVVLNAGHNVSHFALK